MSVTTRHIRFVRAIGRGSAVLLLLAGLPEFDPARADSGFEYRIAPGETHDGDLYLSRGSVDIAGTQNGDIVGFGGPLTISGTVNGDIAYFGQALHLTGTVTDSVRVWAGDVTIAGTIEGDLLVGSGSVRIREQGRITGNLRVLSGQVTIDGVVDGDLRATGGQLALGGSIGGDATLTCDELDIRPEARISGDLVYTSRNRLDLEGTDVVGGEIRFKQERRKKQQRSVSPGSVVLWMWFLLASLVVGFLALAVMKDPARAMVHAIGSDALRSAGVGFVTLIVVPVAAILACILIVTIPLVILVMVLYAIAVYLAKLPVAAWLGGWILRKTGRDDPSPYAAFASGIVVLYVLFLVPVLGKLLWFLCLFLGLGAIILGIRSHRQAKHRPDGPPAEPSAPPPAASPVAP